MRGPAPPLLYWSTLFIYEEKVDEKAGGLPTFLLWGRKVGRIEVDLPTFIL